MVTLYRLALLLLPPGFRRVYGERLCDEAEARLAEASSGRARLRESAALAADLAWTLVHEWSDALMEGARAAAGAGVTSDLRWALRTVARSPGFAAAVVCMLGLGVAATTVALALVDATLLQGLPFPEGERLVALWPSENWSRQMLDLARDGFRSADGIAGFGGERLVLQDGGEPEEVFASQATTNLHDVLGVKPSLGRGFANDDGEPGAEPVVILSHSVWMERFGGQESIIGRSIALGGDGDLRRTVIGVMPEDYRPVQGEGVDVWVPVEMDRASGDYEENYFMEAVARLASGKRPEDAAKDTRALADRLAELHPGWFTAERITRATAVSLAREATAERRIPLLVALGAALLVLLVACANVANLVVARTMGRERELSVRAALGAGRVRAARIVLLELGVLALAGAAAAGVGAYALALGLQRWFPSALPPAGLQMDPRWFGCILVLAFVVAAVAGLIPALQAGRRNPALAILGSRGARRRRGVGRVQGFLSAMQLAMATAAVAAVGLLGRSLVELGDVDPGFDPSAAITFRVTAPPSDFPSDADVTRFFRAARGALEGVPGVVAVGFTSRLPLGGGDSRMTVTPEGWRLAAGDTHPVAWQRLITPGYLEALGARLVAGRIPSAEEDVDGQPEPVVINRAAADAFWPGESAVGKRFYAPDHTEWLTVAGIVDNVLENGQAQPVLPGLYVPHRDWPWRTMYAVVRARENAAAMMPELKRAVWSVSEGVPISRLETLGQVAERGLRPTRILTVLAAVAGTVTLLLGGLGIYGVISHFLMGRMHELGVRAALGAGRTRLLRGELLGTTRLVASGLGVGLVLAWMLGRALRGALYGVRPLDLPSFAAATALLAGVAYLAAYVPARRASIVDPARILREQP